MLECIGKNDDSAARLDAEEAVSWRLLLRRMSGPGFTASPLTKSNGSSKLHGNITPSNWPRRTNDLFMNVQGFF
jgi:hypothetical protein